MDNQTRHLNVGTELGNGKYKILRFIGAGGFGCTYEAEFTIMHSKVAIKEFFVGSCCNRDEDGKISVGTQSQTRFVDQLMDKFLREARNLFRLSHPNIVHVIDVIQENGTSYYVMDYIEGRSLQDIVSEEGPMSEARALHYINQLMYALEYVHSQKMLHLDIKPDNIMVDKNDNAILIDFGVSKQYDEVDGHNTSTIMGQTPGFAPLEQTTNTVKQFTPATDIYSLGATLYAMLTGETPPPTADLMAGLAYLKPLPQDVKPSTRMAINAMMQPKRDYRPQTIAQVRQMLFGVAPSARQSMPDVNQAPPMPPVPPTSGSSTMPLSASSFQGNNATQYIAPASNAPAQPMQGMMPQKPEKKSKVKPWVWIIIAAAVVTLALIIGLIVFIANRVNDDNDYYDPYADEVEAVEEFAVPADDSYYYDSVVAVEEVVPQTPASSSYSSVPATASAGVSGTENGHEWVDMGTSVYWATTNVGTSYEKGNGSFYSWGETSTKSCYDETTSQTYGKSIGSIAGNARYDCARVNWGGSWRMPTKAECQELINKCTWTWYGTGMKVTASNGNVIYLPAAGFAGTTGEALDYQKLGYYWSASPYDNESSWSLTFDSNGARVSSSDDARYWGMSIRPVLDK